MNDKEKLEAYTRLLGKVYDVQVVLSDISHIAEQLGRADLEQEADKLASHYDDVEQELNAAYDKELSND